MDVIVDLQRLAWWSYAFPHLAGLSLEDPRRFTGQLSELISRGGISPLQPIGRAEDVIKSFC